MLSIGPVVAGPGVPPPGGGPFPAAEDKAPKGAEADGSGDQGGYACWGLGEALSDLRQRHGLKLLWSSDVVWDEMQILRPARGGTPRQVLDQILEPFGLQASEVEGSPVLLVVPDGEAAGSRARRPLTGLGGDMERLLPDWLDRDAAMSMWRFPVEPRPALAAATSILIVQIDAAALAQRFDADFVSAAFQLKEALVALGAEGRELRVALEGEAEILEELVAQGLAPYVNAYIHRADPFTPSSDRSARGWARSSASDGPEILQTLLSAAERGDQLVIFEDAQIDLLHGAFLRRIQAIDAADHGEHQAIRGVDSERARLFYDVATGKKYLALYAEEGGHRVELPMPNFRQVKRLFPGPAGELGVERLRERLALRVPGDSPYQLFLFTVASEEPHRGLEVAAEQIYDPYELVVANQVFQERQRERFQSLDVMEYLTVIPQYIGGDQITWEHRILQRKGKLSEYHHLGFWRNGTRYPEDKLLMGRLNRNEALVQLHPLEIELDKTYSYTYLGIETIDSHPSHHIRFEPTRQGNREDGTLVRGEVWLDETTFAHRRVRTYQEGLDGRLVYQDRVYHYEWLAQDGQCFWDWRRREGSYVVSSLGKPFAINTETRRQDFRFNREDIDQIAQQAYESDVMIHVETPPEGHRWLVKLDGERRIARRPDAWESYPGSGMRRSGQASSAPDEGADEDPREGEQEWFSGRVLADASSYSSRASFSVGGFGSGGQDLDLFPGVVLTDQNLFGRDIFGYLGFFKDEIQASISFPRLFGGKAVLTGFLDLPHEEESNRELRSVGESDFSGRFFDFDIRSPAITLSLAMPLRRSLTLDLAYTIRGLEFTAAPEVDFTDFVLPLDTDVHVLDAELGWRWRRWQMAFGVEAGHREDWRAWGLDGSEPAKSDYQVLRFRAFHARRLQGDRMLGTGFSYFKGFDLDRFSRLPGGRARGTVVGFATNVGYDEAAFANGILGASLFRQLPVHLQLEAGVSRYEGNPWQERLGLSFRFLINGPWKTDLWPSVRYSLYSSVPEEEGEVSYGLVIRRRY